MTPSEVQSLRTRADGELCSRPGPGRVQARASTTRLFQDRTERCASTLPPFQGGNEGCSLTIPPFQGGTEGGSTARQLYHARYPIPRIRTRAFSLLEMMIAIVILGLGLIMVATIFPVAWQRARTLTEFTTQQTIAAGAHTVVESLARVSSPATGASSFMGDLVYEPGGPTIQACPGLPNYASDTLVHAFNVENLLVEGRRPVSENIWLRQIPDPALRAALDPIDGDLVGEPHYEDSYFRKRLRFHQRIHPPLDPVPAVDAPPAELTRWDADLSTRRFGWSVLHRLRDRVDVDKPSSTRSIDMYYVTVRRSQSTKRYAQQDPASAPDPCDLEKPPAQPRAQPADLDFMFPVPWRVQVEFPPTLVPKTDPATGASNATGIPTEIVVPPQAVADTNTGIMLVQMFPRGAQFVDEITGQIFRVVKRRIAGDEDEKATLTLDREVFVDDIDLPLNDPRCETCIENLADVWERVRTVWVFPPPVQDDDSSAAGPRLFDGSQPVVGIDMYTIHIAPTQ